MPPFSITVTYFATPVDESHHSRESGNPGYFDPSNGNTFLDARLRGHDLQNAGLLITKYVLVVTNSSTKPGSD